LQRLDLLNFLFLQSILQELLEKTKLDEKLKYLDDAVKRQHDESELKQNNTNTNTNNRTNESDNGMSPEQFLADAMKKAKAEEIRRLNAIVTEVSE
jgi:biopolymer transport protein ExbB/TolQ